MPVTLRRRLQCHYCGKRLNSDHRQKNKVTCDSCAADNFFDENGNITDVPTEEVTRSLHNGSAPREVASQSDVFCSTCLKHQHMYITALSDYLPEPDDPRYAQIEASLPTFKKQFELRFPQCCAQCEPRVRERLREANYTAKSDHLRRVLQRNQVKRRGNQFGWRNIVVTGGGVGYLSGVGIQLVWHAFGSQVDQGRDLNSLSLAHCFSSYPLPMQCEEQLSKLVPISFFMTLLCIWWNPKWQYRIANQDGRLVGLERFYKMQAFILTLRFAAWITLEDVPAVKAFRPALHSVFLIAILIFTTLSLFRTVTVDTSPLVNWHQGSTTLLEPNQFVPPTSADPDLLSLPARSSNQFPLGDLAGTSQPRLESWRPPTPPVDEDSMDWTPSQPTFRPKTRKTFHKTPEPTPFYGKLPAIPARGQPINSTHSLHRPGAESIRPGFFGSRKPLHNAQVSEDAQKSDPPEMAGPRFFPEASRFETGLEDHFKSTFFLRTDAERDELGSKQKSQRDIFGNAVTSSKETGSCMQDHTSDALSSRRVIWSVRHTMSVLILIALGTILISLCTVEYVYGPVRVVPSTVLPYTAVVPVLHFADEMLLRHRLGAASGVWLFALSMITGLSHLVLPMLDLAMIPLWNKVVIGVVCVLLGQELYYFCCAHSVTISNIAAIQMRQSISKAEQEDQPQHEVFSASSQQNSAHTEYIPTATPSGPNVIPLSRRDSNESLSSLSSVKTTSTASGWQTPPVNHRRAGWQPSSASSSRYGATENGTHQFGGLSLGDTFSTGSNIAGPRTRQRGTPSFIRNR